jgi:hypothetical protein
MKQSATQLPALHTFPTAQLVPSAAWDQTLVEVVGVQTWQSAALPAPVA